jgi:hypothetical protein
VSDSPKSPSPRRQFLKSVAGGTAALAAAGSISELVAQQGIPTYPPPQGGWDLSWVGKIEKAKYRAVFDAAEIADGVTFTNATVFMAGNKEVYNAADSDMGLVIVIRHNAITMAVNDAMWERGKLGEALKVNDGDVPATRNMWIGRKAADGTTRPGPMDALMARGVTVLCCNLALMRAAGQFARAQNIPVEEARKLYIDNLVPGIIRQTNGIFATTRAQAAGAPMIKSS